MARHQDESRDAPLFDSLDEETQRLLFPERFDDPATVTLIYRQLEGEAAERAAALESAAAALEHVPATDGEATRATFGLEHLDPLHELYTLLQEEPEAGTVEVLVDGKAVPMVRELWLPLLWCLRA